LLRPDAIEITVPNLSDDIRALVREAPSPVPTDELAVSLGVALEQIEDALDLDDQELAWRPGDTWIHLPTILDGVVALHRLDADEIARGWAHDCADLASVLVCNPPRLADASDGDVVLELTLQEPPHWELPAGVLARAQPGDALRITHTTGGMQLDVVPAAELEGVAVAMSEAEVLGLATAISDLNAEGPVEIADLVLELATWVAPLLRAPRELSAMLAAAGATVVGDFVLPAGADPDQWLAERNRAMLDAGGGWPDAVLDKGLAVLDAIRLIGQGEVLEPEQRGAVVAALADEDAVDLLTDNLMVGLVDRGDELAAMLRAVEAGLQPGAMPAGMHVLLSRLAERAGDLESQLAHTASALVKDKTFGPAWLDRAIDLEEAGELAGALLALRRARVIADDPQMIRLAELLAPPYPDTGRNEACPCESGRKHKACHADGGPPSAEVMIDALVGHAGNWLFRPAQRPLLLRLAAPWLEVLGSLDAVVDDFMAVGVMLFDQGGLAAYAAGRGTLVSAEGQARLARWSDVRLDLVHLTAVSADGVTVRSVLRDELIELQGEDEVELFGSYAVEHAVEDAELLATHLVTRDDGSRRSVLTALPVPAAGGTELADVLRAGDQNRSIVLLAQHAAALQQLFAEQGWTPEV
jgi:hypothetical protein